MFDIGYRFEISVIQYTNKLIEFLSFMTMIVYWL